MDMEIEFKELDAWFKLRISTCMNREYDYRTAFDAWFAKAWIADATIKKLKGGIKKEADYCFEHANKCEETDSERATRHRERGNRLMELFNDR